MKQTKEKTIGEYNTDVQNALYTYQEAVREKMQKERDALAEEVKHLKQKRKELIKKQLDYIHEKLADYLKTHFILHALTDTDKSGEMAMQLNKLIQDKLNEVFKDIERKKLGEF